MDIAVRDLIKRKVKQLFTEEGQVEVLPPEFITTIFNHVSKSAQDNMAATAATAATINAYIESEYPVYYFATQKDLEEWIKFIKIVSLDTDVRDMIRDFAAKFFDPKYRRFRVPESFWSEAYMLVLRCKNDRIQIDKVSRAIAKRIKESYPKIGTNEVQVSVFIKLLLERL